MTSAFITALLAWRVWRGRSSPAEREFALLMVAASIFSAASAWEMAVSDRSTKILCSKLSYLGLVCLPPLWLMFALRYSRRFPWLTRPRALALWSVPLVVLGLVFTNEWHGWVWPAITPLSDAPGARLVYAHGPGVWGFALLYTYPLLLTGSVLLVHTAWKSPRLFRWQVALLVGAAAIPWLGNILYLFNLNPWPGLDLTAPAFMLTGMLISVSIYRYRAINLAPVARDVVFNSMRDPALVLDHQNRLLDLNPAARYCTGLDQADIGQDVSARLQQIPSQGVFDLTFSPLLDSRGWSHGRVALLHDIRRERLLLQVEHRRNSQLTALHSITQALLSALDLQQVFATVVQALQGTFQYHYVSIYRMHGDTLHLGAQAGYPPQQSYATIPVDCGVVGRTVRTRQAQFVPDVSEDPDFLGVMPDIQSEICVPLLQQHTVLGILNVESRAPYSLNLADLEQLTLFAAQVVIAINNANLFQAEREQRLLAEALQAVGLVLSESLDFEAVLDRLLDEISRVVPFDAVSVLLVDENRLHAHVARRRGFDRLGAVHGWKTLCLDYTIAVTPNLRRMVETGQPLLICDAHTDPAWVNLQTTAQLRAWAGAPILLRGRVTGFLSLDKAEPDFYQPEHLQSLAAFTGQAAIAIENARIFTEMQRRAEKERLLLAATRDFTSGLDSDAVLEAVARHMVNGLPVDGCTVSRLDRARDGLVTVLDLNAGRQSPDQPVDKPGTFYPLVQYPVTRAVLESRRPAFLHIDDPGTDPAEQDLLELYGNKAVLMVPLLVGRSGQVYGLIELFRKDSTLPFDPDELEMVQNFTAQAAVALENARMYAEKQRQAVLDELTGVYNRRGLFELGQVEFERSTRFSRPLSVLFIDIDHFKQFNDRYSYALGDHVLRQVAGCITTTLREFDLFGRYGGEEFAALLPEADLESAGEVAERVRLAVQALRLDTGQNWTNVTVSIGVFQRSPHTTTLQDLLDSAGQVVHTAKAAGRNRVAVG